MAAAAKAFAAVSKRQGLRRNPFVRILALTVLFLVFLTYTLRAPPPGVDAVTGSTSTQIQQNLPNGNPKVTLAEPKTEPKPKPIPIPVSKVESSPATKTETTPADALMKAPAGPPSVVPMKTSPQTKEPVPEPAHNIQSEVHVDTSAGILPDCAINATRVQALRKQFDLEQDVQYGQRYIKIRQEDIERKPLTRVKEDLFPEDFETINVDSPPASSKCWKPIEVPVPRSQFPKTVDASDLLFGISTTYKRMWDPVISPIYEWAHWLTDGKGKSNGGGLILRLVDATDAQIISTRDSLRNLGIDVQVFHSNSSIQMAQRYLSLLPALYQDAQKKHRKWLVMCDDDTFFPGMHTLLDRLATYNHKSDLYIGTFSEDVNNIQRHGSQAFGGAGVFFTMHMASVVNEFYEDCSTPEKVAESDTGWGPQGDILLRKCIYENTEVRLTMLRDLHQLDIMGDPAGFYESGQYPLSLHHFKGGIWHVAKPYEGAKIIPVCGEACFLQRFLFSDDFIISNGYSVAYYPRGIQFDLNQMERTFGSAPDDFGWNLDFMLGPGRQSLAHTGRKVAWDLQESIPQADGSIRQVYVRKKWDLRWRESPDGQCIIPIDGILELIWVP